MAAPVLAAVADLNGFLLTRKVHPTLFPYPLLSTLHAARISFVHHALTAKAQREAKGDAKKTTWAYNIVGFLIMCWGGGFLVAFLLHQTPAQLLSIHPFLNYVGVHLVITAALQFVSLPTAQTIDTAFVLIDGALRTHAVVMSVTMATAGGGTAAASAAQNSLLIQIICGTLGATGGGQLAGMLHVVSPNGWALGTPPALLATSIVEVIDVLAAALSAFVFGATTLSHPSYAHVLSLVHDNDGRPLFSPTGARATCTLLFAAAFAYRATVLHWLPATQAVASSAKAAASPSITKALKATTPDLNGSQTPTKRRSASPTKASRNKRES